MEQARCYTVCPSSISPSINSKHREHLQARLRDQAARLHWPLVGGQRGCPKEAHLKMTRDFAFVSSEPETVKTPISIWHHELRDLLQPTGSKDQLLFVNDYRIHLVDFSSSKPVSTYCSLDFRPVCLACAHGVVAAGGQHGELALRPLQDLERQRHGSLAAAGASGSRSSSSSRAPRIGNYPLDGSAPSTPVSMRSSANEIQEATSQQHRAPLAWALNHPTGGSINNSIHIQPDVPPPPPTSSQFATPASSRPYSRRGSSYTSTSTSSSPSRRTSSTMKWRRDAPSGTLSQQRHQPEDGDVALADPLFEEDVALLESRPGHDRRRSGSPVRVGAGDFGRGDARGSSGGIRLADPSSQTQQENGRVQLGPKPVAGGVRVMVNNNDQSIKGYRLRHPSSSLGAQGRLESGLPGLSKMHTLHFPTAINHSSLSPDRRTLVAVGDSPDVFLYNCDPSGTYSQIAKYQTTDSSFSTSWHPDGTKFAVGSQDGTVNVWDVRSSRPIAILSTSLDNSSFRPRNAARIVKFSPKGDMLAFTEHFSHVHIYDTESFTHHQRITLPMASKLPSGMSHEQIDPPRGSESRTASSRSSGSHGSDAPRASSAERVPAEAEPVPWNIAEVQMAEEEELLDTHRWSPAPVEPTTEVRDLSSPSDTEHIADAFRAVNGLARRSRQLSVPYGAGMAGSSNTTAAAAIVAAEAAASASGSGLGGLSRPTRPWLTSRAATSSANVLSRLLAGAPWEERAGVGAGSGSGTGAGIGQQHWSAVMEQMVQEELQGENNLLRARRRLPLLYPSSWDRARGVREMPDFIDISGLCWDPAGDYLYVSTTTLIARYEVLDKRMSFSGGGLL
ncbi:hypothetical protein K437DRAFT_125804 [Tilletiaria anomala UBC 951]|uniref:DUF2415 domain-containing protein n=1 Tax=Tilletiaria anomala (strain ATCC 24038 / CBS 436.72 / UBC 951) TaxID=1037660 RepID=A0A066VTM8_TILAU|nr:uncharacterized protein K437DRAFT_125804 [Tilletiaria anomala UBC 951]KDN45082.1 hypothetical protein K437DRAFT_125804 [Tilletiaria anomala UBC 951]